jgi:retron-type reverse transcriptase
MASGRYFPPAIKEVEIPKKDGKTRKLGIPTISYRVAQMVVKDYLEARFERIFSPHSYGYRPDKNVHQALESVRTNCRKADWVIDLDIKGFFDTIDHNKLMQALKKHVSEKWCLMYIDGYDCAISTDSKKRIAEKMRELDIKHLTHESIVGVAKFLEPYIRGWVNYFGKFRISEMNPIFQLLRRRLVMWARKRYKRYKTSLNRAYKWLERIRQ